MVRDLFSKRCKYLEAIVSRDVCFTTIHLDISFMTFFFLKKWIVKTDALNWPVPPRIFYFVWKLTLNRIYLILLDLENKDDTKVVI